MTNLEAEHTYIYVNVLKAFALHATEIKVKSDCEALKTRLYKSIEVFASHLDLLDKIIDLSIQPDIETLYITALIYTGKLVVEARIVEAEDTALTVEKLTSLRAGIRLSDAIYIYVRLPRPWKPQAG